MFLVRMSSFIISCSGQCNMKKIDQWLGAARCQPAVSSKCEGRQVDTLDDTGLPWSI